MSLRSRNWKSGELKLGRDYITYFTCELDTQASWTPENTIVNARYSTFIPQQPYIDFISLFADSY